MNLLIWSIQCGDPTFIASLDITLYGESILNHPLNFHLLKSAADWTFISPMETSIPKRNIWQGTISMDEMCMIQYPIDKGIYKVLSFIIIHADMAKKVFQSFSKMTQDI